MLDKILANLKRQTWIKILLQKSNVYLVGGSVRDAFLNKPIKDIDLVVEGLSMTQIQDLIGDYGKSKITGESFKVIKFRPHGHVGEDYDIAIPRKDRKVGTGHKGFEVVTEGVDIFGDLKRRDFTVNSIAIDIKTGRMIDPFNGMRDLKAKTLRATDKTAFTEDALRIIRAIQFAARFRFSIEPETLTMMRQHSQLLKEISGERIHEEFEKILNKNGSTKLAFELMWKSDIDKALFDNKFVSHNFDSFDNLDPASFFFILGTLGGVTPSVFYAKRLLSEKENKIKKNDMVKALQNIEKHLASFDKASEVELKWNVFQMLKGSPQLKDAVVLPANVDAVIKDMKAGKIPMKMGDIPVTGNELMDKFNVTGAEVGNIINIMYQEALMNKFDWKNKEKTLKYLQNL